MKVCSKCKVSKYTKDFYKCSKAKDGFNYYCKLCVKQYKNPEKSKKYYQNNKTKARNHASLNSFGISLDDKKKLLELQDNKCAICRTDNPGKRDWHTDHDHSSVDKIKIRGILCRDCNIMLGMAKDNINILTKAIDYLKSKKS